MTAEMSRGSPFCEAESDGNTRETRATQQQEKKRKRENKRSRQRERERERERDEWWGAVNDSGVSAAAIDRWRSMNHRNPKGHGVFFFFFLFFWRPFHPFDAQFCVRSVLFVLFFWHGADGEPFTASSYFCVTGFLLGFFIFTFFFTASVTGRRNESAVRRRPVEEQTTLCHRWRQMTMRSRKKTKKKVPKSGKRGKSRSSKKKNKKNKKKEPSTPISCAQRSCLVFVVFFLLLFFFLCLIFDSSLVFTDFSRFTPRFIGFLFFWRPLMKWAWESRKKKKNDTAGPF